MSDIQGGITQPQQAFGFFTICSLSLFISLAATHDLVSSHLIQILQDLFTDNNMPPSHACFRLALIAAICKVSENYIKPRQPAGPSVVLKKKAQKWVLHNLSFQICGPFNFADRDLVLHLCWRGAVFFKLPETLSRQKPCQVQVLIILGRSDSLIKREDVGLETSHKYDVTVFCLLCNMFNCHRRAWPFTWIDRIQNGSTIRIHVLFVIKNKQAMCIQTVHFFFFLYFYLSTCEVKSQCSGIPGKP